MFCGGLEGVVLCYAAQRAIYACIGKAGFNIFYQFWKFAPGPSHVFVYLLSMGGGVKRFESPDI